MQALQKPGYHPFDSIRNGLADVLESNGSFNGFSRYPAICGKKVLYLTTIGQRTGSPRQIEIWFVVYGEHFYLFAETGEAAAWVKNIRRNPEVVVRIGERQIGARARVLDRESDRELWDQVAAIADRNTDGATGCRWKSPRLRRARPIPIPLLSQPRIAELTARGLHEAVCDLPHGGERRWPDFDRLGVDAWLWAASPASNTRSATLSAPDRPAPPAGGLVRPPRRRCLRHCARRPRQDRLGPRRHRRQFDCDRADRAGWRRPPRRAP